MREIENKKTSEFLTTGQIAVYCGVNFRTVIRWIQKGYLEAQRLPGRGDHRVSRDQFLTFLKKNNLSVPDDLLLNKNQPIVDIKDNENYNTSIKKVLIVDDDPITAKAIQRVLQLHHYETKIAADGFEAGRLVETFSPSLITLDLLMHGMDGISVLNVLKKDERLNSLKVIVISSDSDEKIKQALSLGAASALKKPFSNKELVSTVVKLIGESSNPETSNLF